MKTTIKRTLATVLTVVMIFSLVPFAGTIFGSMSTKVSALETVEGSFDYLVDYLKSHGKTNSDGNKYIIDSSTYQGNTEYCQIIYKYPYLQFVYWLNYNTGSKDVCQMTISEDDDCYEVFCYSQKKSGYDSAYATVNPKEYNVSYKLHYYDKKYENNRDEEMVELFFDMSFLSLISNSNSLLYKKVKKLSVANFGFINIDVPIEIVDTYTVYLNANGGTVEQSSIRVKENEKFTLPTPKRDKYICLGWAKNQNANSAEYKCGNRYSTSSDITLYAIWQKNEFTIYFDANGGKVTPERITVSENELFILPTPVREGYTCLGWSTDKNATEAKYSCEVSYSADADFYLYAVWQKNPDEPTVEPDEPTVDPDEPTVDPDEPTVDPDEPTVDPDEPTVEPDKPSTDPVKPDDSKTPEDPSKPADAVTPGDSKTTASDAQKESGVKADTDAVISYKSSANRDGGTSPDTSESMDGIIAAVVTAFVGVTGLIIVKKKEKNED